MAYFMGSVFHLSLDTSGVLTHSFLPALSYLVMACTIEKILTDARTLLERLKDHDNAAESLIDQSTVLHKRVVAMKEAGTALSHKVNADLALAGISCICRGVIMHALILWSHTEFFALQVPGRCH